MSPFPLLWLAVALAAEPHEKINPVYRELRDPGIGVGSKMMVPLPAPTMPDGLSAKEQQAVLAKLAGDDYPLEELLRKSVVAPHILQFLDVKPSDPQAPARGIDVYYVLHGDLDAITKKDFVEHLVSTKDKESKGKTLSNADLAKRKIAEIPAARKDQEGYHHSRFALLERVQIGGTSHMAWSRTGDSVLAATVLDPRFGGDAEFPNVWRPIKNEAGQDPELGPPSPYEGSGHYLKITRLAEPKGALFVEFHLIFTEPQKWFGGNNLLRSKVPLVVQSEVRAFRRQVAKLSKGSD